MAYYDHAFKTESVDVLSFDLTSFKVSLKSAQRLSKIYHLLQNIQPKNVDDYISCQVTRLHKSEDSLGQNGR